MIINQSVANAFPPWLLAALWIWVPSNNQSAQIHYSNSRLNTPQAIQLVATAALTTQPPFFSPSRILLALISPACLLLTFTETGGGHLNRWPSQRASSCNLSFCVLAEDPCFTASFNKDQQKASLIAPPIFNHSGKDQQQGSIDFSWVPKSSVPAQNPGTPEP